MLYPNDLSTGLIFQMPSSTLASKPATDNVGGAAGKLSKSHKPGIPRPASIRNSLGIGKTGVSKALAEVVNHKQTHDSPPKDTAKEPRRHSGLPFGSKHPPLQSKVKGSSPAADADNEGSVTHRRCSYPLDNDNIYL
jgi:hypothetical protein